MNNLKVFTAVMQARMVGNGIEILHSEITCSKCTDWCYNYPKYNVTQLWAEVPSQELSDTMIKVFKDRL